MTNKKSFIDLFHRGAIALVEYKLAHPEHCTECDSNGYHVADCPRYEPELPARIEHCRCGSRLETERELASFSELGYPRCDDCDDASKAEEWE